MSEARLKAGLWVRAALRAMTVQGLFATVVRKGDEDAGALLIKQNFLDGRFCVLSRMTTAGGLPSWHAGTGGERVEESAADAYINREINRDRDLWVIEIEDREGRLPFGETTESGRTGS
jgi:GMP synthase (glutamine-hydrolysing)